jgi:hypothetical protein
LRDGLKMLEELIYVRWNSLVGVYNREVRDMAPAEGAVSRIR